MGSHCNTITGSHINLPLLLLSLLLLCSTQVRTSAEGEHTFGHPQAAKDAEEKVLMRAMIGSRPPRCERRCASCGHCEAVQVPAVPQGGGRAGDLFARINSRGDDSSNYKPVSWKCKCGDIILNP